MNTKVAFVACVTFLSAIFSVNAQETGKCGPNEVWHHCTAHCGPQCNASEFRVCPRICVAGCKCKPGYLRSSRVNAECVLASDCPVDIKTVEYNCPENSYWTDCGSPCPNICNINIRQRCTKVCTPRCECQQGYRLTKSGLCIPSTDCVPLLPFSY